MQIRVDRIEGEDPLVAVLEFSSPAWGNTRQLIDVPLAELPGGTQEGDCLDVINHSLTARRAGAGATGVAWGSFEDWYDRTVTGRVTVRAIGREEARRCYEDAAWIEAHESERRAASDQVNATTDRPQ